MRDSKTDSDMKDGSRQSKIQLLKDLETGRKSVQDLSQPKYGVLFMRDGKAVGYEAIGIKREFNPPVDRSEVKDKVTHVIEFCDFSGTTAC